MTKQELLKTYPELVKEIAGELFSEHIQRDTKAKGFEQTFNTYLKEQTKADWEIISIILDSKLMYVKDVVLYESMRLSVSANVNDKFNTDLDTWDYIFNKRASSIHSVQRISDGEIFTVGDKITDQTHINKAYTIEAIRINENYSGNLLIVINVKNNYGIALKEAQKAIPLFKTEDGVNVYEPGDYYSIRGLFTLCREYVESKAKANYHIKEGYKYFSTKEAAEDYILMNKPILSVQELAAYLDSVPETRNIPDVIQEFKKLAQQKLNSNGSNT